MDNFRSSFDFTARRNWARRFFDFDIGEYRVLPGKDRAMEVFHYAAKHVPAYRDFLKKQGIIPTKVKDVAELPITDKKNYIQQYPLKARMADSAQIIAMSSGTSGESTFWPRGGYQEFEQAVTHEMLYRTYFEIHKRRTLTLICFPMGVYVSGVATLVPSWLVAQKYPNLSLVSVGNKQADILKALAHLKDDYEQIALVGHPFIIKDVLETAKKQKISLKDRRVGIMCCSESFSEDWRNHVSKIINHPSSIIHNTYGSSELLLIGYEMPGKIGYSYNPFLRYVESIDSELLFTSYSGIPLIRFNLHDRGTIKDNVITLQGRSDYAVIFYAANIYPEHIRAGLNHRMWYGKLTGKFVMHKKYLRNRDEVLEINIELRQGIKASPDFTKEIQKNIVATLQKINMEYADISRRFGPRVIPRINLLPYQEPKYFPLGLKPRYILSPPAPSYR